MEISAADINLKFPYWTAACFVSLLALLFTVAQFYENKLHNEHEINRRTYMLLMEDSDMEGSKLIDSLIHSDSSEVKIREISKLNLFIQKLLFSKKIHQGTALGYLLIQIFLFLFLFIFTQGAFTILTRFMFTYLSKGPCQSETQSYVVLETVFWVFIILSRFLAAFVSTKMNAINFFFFILFFNTTISGLFLAPSLTSSGLFFWAFIPLVGFSTGPLIPCGLMIAKKVLEFNSFLLSIFIVGLAVGGIVFQELTGTLLDQEWPDFPNSAYILPHLVCLCNFLSLMIFLPIFFLHKKFNNLIQ